ncbi:MAG TPA: hypothetical protein VJA94_11460 [Candidatus Angelobacter sp.]
MARETRITIETESLLVLRGRAPLIGWCPQCSAESEMIPLEGMGVVSNLPPEEVERWLESEALHRSQAADGGPLLCLNSLLKRLKSGNGQQAIHGRQGPSSGNRDNR